MYRTAFVLLILMLVACGDQTVVVPDPETPVGPPDPYGDPPDYAGDPFAGFGEIVTVEVPGETETVVDETVEETVEVPVEDSNLPFAVQISAAAEEATATRLAEQVGAEVDAPVYIDHVGQYWKVRVGAFATREETGALLLQLQEMGFTDAWVVERVP
jgi:hypothetical protein